MTDKSLVVPETADLSTDEVNFISKELASVRDEVVDNPYILEALRVLPVKGYRSTIGSYWNAVVDDLRNKIIHRSLDLFNKEVSPRREIKKYEDFQDYTTEHELIEGAYKIGVLSWEGKKILHQARDTRNIFYGHPKSSEPTLIKVLNIISDCNKYVLSEEFPPAIIDISSYLKLMDSEDYDRNELAIEQAFTDLPAVYKTELSNRFYSTYCMESISTELRSNIEFCAPILWDILIKEDKHQIGKRFDKDMVEADKGIIKRGFNFIKMVGGMMYVSTASRKIKFEPIIAKLESSLDDWPMEERICKALKSLGSNIPLELIPRYVSAITLTFVGYKGASTRFARTDFYANGASLNIKNMFHAFDNDSVKAFIETIRTNKILIKRIKKSGQLSRLRILGNILVEKGHFEKESMDFLKILVDEDKTGDFYTAIGE